MAKFRHVRPGGGKPKPVPGGTSEGAFSAASTTDAAWVSAATAESAFTSASMTGTAFVGSSSGGATGVLSESDLTLLGGFRMPSFFTYGYPASEQGFSNGSTGGTSFGFAMTAGVALRRVSGQVRLFAMGTAFEEGVYEVTVPGTLGSGINPATWPQVASTNEWGNIYNSFGTQSKNVRSYTPASTSIELQESQHHPDDYYNGYILKITSGPGAGESRTVTDYVGSTRTATIASAFSTAPTTASKYIFYNDTAAGGGTNYITLGPSASSVNDTYNYYVLHIVEGRGVGQWIMIQDYDGATKRAYIPFASWQAAMGNWLTPDNTSVYRIEYACKFFWVPEGAYQFWICQPAWGNQLKTNGLFWDETDQRLYYSWSFGYGQIPITPSIAYSKLDDTTKCATPYGPWRLDNASDRLSSSGILALPTNFANTYCSGRRIGVGLGGYGYSTVSNASCGPALMAIDPPTPPAGNVNRPLNENFSDTNNWPALPRTMLINHSNHNTQPFAPFPGWRNSNTINRDPNDGPWAGTIESRSELTESGSTQSGSTTTRIYIDAAANGADWYYHGGTITLTSGPLSGVSRIVYFSSGSPKYVEFYGDPLASAPGSGISYTWSRGFLTFTSTSPCIWRENSAANGYGFLSHTCEITSGPLAGTKRLITRNSRAQDPATADRSFWLATGWGTLPDVGVTFEVYTGNPQTGSTSSTLKLQAESFTNFNPPNAPLNVYYYAAIVAGTGTGQEERKITAYNTSTKVASVTPDWTTTPDTTSKYIIYITGMPTIWDPEGGHGYHTLQDEVSGGCWIERPSKSALLLLQVWGEGRNYYEASTIYSSEGKRLNFTFYDPSELAQAAQGGKQVWEVNPTSMARWPGVAAGRLHDVIGTPNSASCVYDPVDNRLYVLVANAWLDGTEYRPAVFVYSVA